MKETYRNLLSQYKKWKKKTFLTIFIAIILLILILGFFVGIQYSLAAATIGLLIYLMNQAEQEKGPTFDEREKIKDEIETLLEKKEIIEKHVQDNHQDLTAKLELLSISKQIKDLEKKIK